MLHEIKRIKVHSLKEFIKEFLMIVVGILTALGLEHIAVSIHNKHAAEEGLQRVLAEQKANLAYTEQFLQEAHRRWDPLNEVIAALDQDISNKVAKDKINQHLKAMLKSSGYNRGTPGFILRQSSWELVIANQSLSHMDAQQASVLANQYSLNKMYMTGFNQGMQELYTDRENDMYVELSYDLVEPMEAIKILRSKRSTQSSMMAIATEVKAHIENTLQKAEAQGNGTH
ncbi:hypothetical protein KSF73_06430 [Burkholderiaceae bacterium DAT-1]|nr:hypothetical protein [Burkholderiaceae bacterium DAT-1]